MSAVGWRRIPRGVWALGLVSLCMDLSSELVHALLPLYMATVLGASMLTIGLIEGVAEATALVVKVFSGVLSDLFARRKPLVVLGYGLGAVTKLVFPLAPSLSWIVGARFVDRIGKGIRGAPRDALIADIAPAGLRGASFGLRQTLDTVGGFGRTIADAALLGAVLTGDQRLVQQPLPDTLRIGLVQGPDWGEAEPDVEAAWARAVQALAPQAQRCEDV